jgi:hypothetical protein
MKSSLSLIRQKLDACKKEVIELEEMHNQIKEALDTAPFTPRHRQQIKTTFLRCAKNITMLKSRVLTTELLSMQKEKMEMKASSISVPSDSTRHLSAGA